MKFYLDEATTFTGAAAWDALDIAEVDGASVRLHWTDAPYKWHVNDGDEVFVVLDGAVDMHWKERHWKDGHWKDGAGAERVTRLGPGQFCHAGPGDAHVAHPVGAARILVIERKGSV